MTVLIKALQVILALSVLILIHEAGHFLWAKLFKIRVDKFFLFFDLGGFKLFSTKQKWFVKLFPKAASWETEYGIGWLPLGGYCKIAGMIDESLDTKQLGGEPKPWEFRSKPAWKRFIVMGGGVLNNFIFAILLFILMLDIWGSAYIRNDASTPIYVNELAREMGFRNGDVILRYDDYVPEDFSMLQVDLARRDVRKAEVLRGADTVTIYIDQSRIGAVLQTPGMFDLALPFVVDSVAADSPNADILLRGDKITSIDSMEVAYLQDARPLLEKYAGKEVVCRVERDNAAMSIPLKVDSLGRVGVIVQYPGYEFRDYGFWEAIPEGCKEAWNTVDGYVRDLRLVFTPRTEAYKSVGSFIAIGQVFPARWNWYQFLYIMALLSIMLGVMNLIPIPALDGGHMVFCLYEMITRRKPSDRFILVAQLIGMMLLVALMILAFGNDITRLLR